MMLGIPLLLGSCGSSIGEEGKTTVSLWAWGDEAEVNVFQNLLRDYNAVNEDNIYVNFVKKPSSSYYSVLETALTGRQTPDLFYVGDSMVKRYAKDGYLENLEEYIATSTEIDLDDIWATLMQRYQFDVDTYQYMPEASIWGLPKDIGPTVIYYNEDALLAQGIKIISAYDDNQDGKVVYQDLEYDARGYDPDGKVFNNKIAMTFEESDVLSTLLSKGRTIPSTHQTRWGFYSSWWFYAGWSIGGDVIHFKETDDPAYNGGYWEFTLDDENPNYRVLKSVTINGHDYSPDSFVDYYDLPFMASHGPETAALVASGHVVELPSIRETFDYWISNFQSGLSPKPSDISNEMALFTNQDVALFVEGRYATVEFRKSADFSWDVAPLPRHANGSSGGHSGSMCISMAKKSTVKPQAFKIIEYLSGSSGQDALAATGFNVPNQISIASNPEKNFLSSTARPYNNEVFLDAAEVQRGGDWTYLADDVWIELWAPTLNGNVLNGVATVDSLFANYKGITNEKLKTYTLKS
jgi:multiple sugar transport system substrate-binding protein